MTRPTTAGGLSRRELLRSGVAVPVGLAAFGPDAGRAAPPYRLSINIEIMINRLNLPRADRIRFVADHGFTGYSYWNADAADRAAMLQAQRQTGLTCVSLVGTGSAGGTTGFTRPGAADLLLAEFRERVAIAKDFGAPDLISFVGQVQSDVPWDVQRQGIVDGLRRAGDIAAAGGVTITVEPLSVGANQPRRALDRAVDCFPVIRDVNHPNVKVCSARTISAIHSSPRSPSCFWIAHWKSRVRSTG
jgi:hydroxypyruvate isomerase